jgi:GNAT superfamily N-acetyltransferase
MPEACSKQIRIEPAGREAQAKIRSMIRAGNLNPLGLDWRHFLLAIDPDDGIIGCVQVKVHRGGARELASLYVQPSWRRCKVGSRLVEMILDEQSPPLWLTCRKRLTGFYRRFGFIIVDQPREMPAYFRIVWRLFKIIQVLGSFEAGLAVMRWSGTRSP